MKKSIKTLALAAMMLVAGSAMTVKAQLLSEKPHVHFGVRGGVSVSSYSADGMDSKTYPTAGLAADFKVAPFPLYVETGAYFVNKGYNLNLSEYSKDDGGYDCIGAEIPLVASYHHYFTDNMAIQPFFGGFVSYTFGDEMNDVDYGLRFGTGFNYGRLYANIGYDLGLKNWADDGYPSNKSGFFFVTLGFNFVGSK